MVTDGEHKGQYKDERSPAATYLNETIIISLYIYILLSVSNELSNF